MNRKQKSCLIRIIISSVLLAVLNIPVFRQLPFSSYFIPAAYIAVYLLIGYDVLRKAFLGIIRLNPFNECFLMAIATIGAFVLSFLRGGEGDFNEAVAVMLFYQVGELFQSYAVGKSRKSISALMDIRPEVAHVVTEDGNISDASPEEVSTGSIIEVRPGEKIPLDGEVVSGDSSVNTSALTGESLPKDVSEGSEVMGGFINLSGVVRIRTTKPFGESSVSRILKLVEEAGSRKADTEQFVSRFAKIYTPAVVFSAVALAIIPPTAILLFTGTADYLEWVYRALTFLVISCPCALVVSVPLTFFAGLGGAGKKGILIKGAKYLETLSGVSAVVFDKTGTVTKGVLSVEAVHHCPVSPETIIEYAAHLEQFSSHPVARCIVEAYGKTPDRSRVKNLTEEAGRGLYGSVDGTQVFAGNEKMMEEHGFEYHKCSCPGTIVHIVINGTYSGHLLITDRIKENAADCVRELKSAGVKRTVMLTGDAASAAKEIAKSAGIDTVIPELLPEDKVSNLEKILSEENSGKVAFAGDGVNDAPVLTRADVGIAMGAIGSEAAIEASDVVITDDDIMKIPLAVRIGKKCMRIVRENIAFAIAVKAVCLVLGAFGTVGMPVAVFADVGVLTLAVVNAIRAMRIKTR